MRWLLILLLFIGCHTTSTPPLKIAMNTWPGYELLYLAQEKGFFEEQGIKVQIKEFATLSDARRVFERGQADILTGTLCELLLVRAHAKQDAQAFFVTDYSYGGDVIVAHKSIEGLRQLRGKKIGVELGSLSPYLLYRALSLQKMSFKDVGALHMSQVEMAEGLKLGKIEAAVMYSPFSTQLLKNPEYKIIFDSREIPGEIVDTLIAARSVLEQRHQEIAGLLLAYKKAMEYTKKFPKEAYAIMAEREKVSVEDFKNSFEQNIKMVSYEEQQSILAGDKSVAQILPNVELVMRETGQLVTPLPLSQSIYSDFFPKK